MTRITNSHFNSLHKNTTFRELNLCNIFWFGPQRWWNLVPGGPRSSISKALFSLQITRLITHVIIFYELVFIRLKGVTPASIAVAVTVAQVANCNTEFIRNKGPLLKVVWRRTARTAHCANVSRAANVGRPRVGRVTLVA